jgi:hypothetical protein
MQLANITSPTGRARATISLLVEWTSFSRPSVVRALDQLEERGLIVRHRPGHRRSSYYDLHLPDYETAKSARKERQRGRAPKDSQRTKRSVTVTPQKSHRDISDESGRATIRNLPVNITGLSPEPTRQDKTPRTHGGFVPTSDRLDNILNGLQPDSTDDS